MRSLFVIITLITFVSLAQAASYRCDFNNDGYEDLPIGVPGENFVTGTENLPAAGRVHIIYGTNTGLSANGSQLWSKDSPGVLGQPDEYTEFGAALVCGDFDGNEYNDLAIGDPSFYDGGSVTILYGSSAGLTAGGNQLLNQDMSGVLDASEEGDRFGAALAAGDFNGDGYSDLAVGVPGEAISTYLGAGAVHIFYGSSIGITSANNQFWTQNSPGIADFVEGGDDFGNTLATGNFGKDASTGCFDDLAIGVEESFGKPTDEEKYYAYPFAGAVHILYGTNGGLSAPGSQLFHENTPGIPDELEPRDFFGSSLAAGVFAGASTSACGALSDLAIGIPGEQINDVNFNSGAVLVMYATVNGLSTEGNQFWHQDSPGVPDTTNGRDFYGAALATARTASGRDYLAIGAPGEVLGAANYTGIVDVFYSDPATGKLTATGMKHYSQDALGVPDTNETDDQFGFALFAGNFNGSGDDDLAIGSPGESFNTITHAGAVHILFGASTNTTQFWNQNSAGIADYMELEDKFGAVLASSKNLEGPGFRYK